MTPTPPQSTGHSPQEGPPSTNAYRVVRKRNRIPLSCGPCRNRKLKCNRANPCENCVRRGDSHACTYASTPHSSSVRARKQSSGSSGSASSDEMQSRIDRLEGLVLSLMSGNGTNVSPRDRGRSNSTDQGDEDDADAMHSIHEDDSQHRSGDDMEEEVEEVRNALGIMRVVHGKSYYRGETHWAVILSEITEVKKFFEETKAKYESQLAEMKGSMTQNLQATGFPFSASKPPTRQEILALVPRQELVDILVDAYFRNYDPIFHVLHRPSFYKQYEDFWRDPSKCDTLWLGLLMMIMSIALRIYHYSGEEPSELHGKTMEMSTAFRIAAEQALIVGEYTKKLYLHMVQTLILLCTASTHKDNVDNSWLFLGMVVRVAMSMGLHRDPEQFPQISYGEREIRRRLWTVITCSDLLYSVQLGLPPMVKQEECDTKLPRNLHDDEIGEGITEEPPERGREELTGVSYMIAKASMAHMYWEIVRQLNSLAPRPPYDTILRLDTEIQEEYAKAPTFLRLKTKEESKNDPAWLIIQRYNLDLLRQKALISLHRPYASKADVAPRFMYSRRQCVDAAMALLRHQTAISMESKSSLRHARWFTESLGGNDFLQAAMIVCLHLLKSCAAAQREGVAWQFGSFTRAEKYEALESMREIYRQQQDDNHDAQKAYGIISIMLDKLAREEAIARNGGFDSTGAPAAPGSSFAPPTNNTGGSCTGKPHSGPDLSASTSTGPAKGTDGTSDPLRSEQAAAMTLGMMSGGGLTPSSAATLFATTSSPAVTTPGGSMLLGDAATTTNSTSNVSSQATTLVGSFSPLSQSPAYLTGGAALSPPSTWSGSIEMPSGLEWDEWDDFMQGINLDTSQLSGWPVMAGLSNNYLYHPVTSPAAAAELAKRNQEINEVIAATAAENAAAAAVVTDKEEGPG